MVKMRTRIDIPDILKGVAVLLMIQVHLMELFATEEIYKSIAGKISLFLGGPPAAPVFMLVMGYFVASSSRSHSQLIFRGLKLIGLGFVLNIGLNLNLLIKIYNGSFNFNPWPYIFGVDILFLAGLSIIIIAVLKVLFDEKIFLWVIACLLAAALNHFLPVYSGDTEWIKYLQAYFWGYYWWSYFPLFPWLAYSLLGYIVYLLYQKEGFKQIPDRVIHYAAGTSLILLIFTFQFGLQGSVLLNVYYHHSLLYFFWVCVFLIFWFCLLKIIFSNSSTWISKYLRWTGRNVTAIYVIQWLIIGNIATEIYKTQQMVQLLVWAFLVVLVTSLIVFGFQKLRSKIL